MKLNTICLVLWFCFMAECGSFTALSNFVGRQKLNLHSAAKLEGVRETISMLSSYPSTYESWKNEYSPNRRSFRSASLSSDNSIQPTKLFLSSNSLSSLNESNSEIDETNETIRDKLRKATGFSLSAIRVAIRASTGFSLTALRTTLRGLTGVSITGTLKVITGAFPLWVSPFFIELFIPMDYNMTILDNLAFKYHFCQL